MNKIRIYTLFLSSARCRRNCGGCNTPFYDHVGEEDCRRFRDGPSYDSALPSFLRTQVLGPEQVNVGLEGVNGVLFTI